MFGQSLLSAFGIACTTDTDQLFTTPTSTASVATYQLNNATTSIPNNTYPGTASNITYAAGKFGNAAVFNGSNSTITIAENPVFNFTTPSSLSVWVNRNTTNREFIIDKGNGSSGSYGWQFEYNNTQYVFQLNNTAGGIMDLRATTTSGTGIWDHIVVTYDSSQVGKIYLNGVLKATDTMSGTASFNTNGVTIGKYSLASGYEFDGKLDQIRFFNTTLPQSAVTALYNETATTAQSNNIDYQLANPNSVAYYKMSDATDQLGNYNGVATDVNFNTEGKFGFAGSFNGSSSKIEIIPSPQDNSGVMSVSFWAKTSSTSRTAFFIAEAPNPNKEFLKLENFGYNGTNSFRVTYNNSFSANINNAAISDNNWHHIVVTAGNGNLKTYKDNVLLATHSITITDQTLDAFAIGFRKYNNDLYFDGEIDQVRIYDAVLSAADVSTLYKEVECQPAAINALDHFNTVLYDGTGGSQSTNSLSNQVGTLGFAPGMTWLKSRSNATWHEVHDVVRGNLPRIFPNDAYQELTSANGFASLNSNGFSLDGTGGGGDVNTSGRTYVAWNWKAPLANLSTSFNGSSTVGSASKIDLTGSTTLTTRSISLWVNLAGTGSGGNLILDNSDGQNPGVVQYGKWEIQLQYGGTNYFCWDTYTGGSYGICDVNYTFNLNTWYHIVFVAEANNQAVYINGVSQTLQNVSRPGDIGTVTMSTNRLGASWSTQYTHAFNGTMGQVRIFNDALTASEVADLYAEPATSNNTLNYPAGAGCIAAYPLQTDAVDLSGNYSGATSNVTFGQPGYLTGNTEGTIPSTVAVDQAAGFSIVGYTATGSTATVGHGLGAPPDLILAKTRNQAYNWIAYSSALGSSTQLLLDSSNAAQTGSSIMASTDPTSTVFTAGAGNNLNYANGNTIIAYCFKSTPGFSKIGSYLGNGTSQSLYTGFAVKFVLIKSATSSQNWMMYDSTRGGNKYLIADSAGAQGTSGSNLVTFNSNGFSVSNSNSENQSGETFIFLAIA